MLSGSNPSEGNTFIDVFEAEAKKIEDAAAQKGEVSKIGFFLQ